MTALSAPTTPTAEAVRAPAPDSLRRRLLGNRRIVAGGGFVLVVLLACLVSLPWTAGPGTAEHPHGLYYDGQHGAKDVSAAVLARSTTPPWPPAAGPAWLSMGTSKLGQSLLGRCLMGGVISLSIGLASAAIAVVLGVTVGMVAGYRGGWVDSALMRLVDILYGLPYILMVVLLKIGLQPVFAWGPVAWVLEHLTRSAAQAANVAVLFLAIGLVSWLTMARVIRGQVLALRQMPFVDAAHAIGVPEWRIFLHHLLPNLVGPISVYATLTVPSAILQESTLSFLNIGIQPPLPTWGSLASEGLGLALNPVEPRWWLLVFPCLLLAATLLALNFLGDGLRDVFDPKRRAANV